MKIKRSLIGVILLTMTIFPNCQISKSVPNDLIGTWITEAQEYKGSYFELNQKSILFSKKDGTIDDFAIIKIKRSKMKGEWVKYTIYYRDRQLKKYELPILYHPHSYGTIRFMNREQNTWIRESPKFRDKGEFE